MIYRKTRFPFQVMDMEHELQALRTQLAEKSKHSLQLQKEVWSYCIHSHHLFYFLILSSSIIYVLMGGVRIVIWNLKLLQRSIILAFNNCHKWKREYIYIVPCYVWRYNAYKLYHAMFDNVVPSISYFILFEIHETVEVNASCEIWLFPLKSI